MALGQRSAVLLVDTDRRADMGFGRLRVPLREKEKAEIQMDGAGLGGFRVDLLPDRQGLPQETFGFGAPSLQPRRLGQTAQAPGAFRPSRVELFADRQGAP